MLVRPLPGCTLTRQELRETHGKGFCPLVTDEETKVRLMGGAPRPQYKSWNLELSCLNSRRDAPSTPENSLREDADRLPAPGPRGRQRSREGGRHTQGAGPMGGSSLSPGLPATFSLSVLEGLAFLQLSQALASGRPHLLLPGAWPGHCFCTFSKLKTHCSPFLGKKS